MQFKVFYVPVHGATEIEEELNAFLRSHKVVEIDKQFVLGDKPAWCFCIGFLLQVNSGSSKAPKVNYESILGKEEFARFERLREHRKKVAQELKIPAYAVFTNKELADLAKKENISADDLLQMPGFGQGRMEKVGQYFLKQINHVGGSL